MPTDWETKYLQGDTPWDKGEPSPGLIDFLRRHPELPRGRVLVPGCGMGHDVRAWSAAGFPAVGMDVAPSAIQRCREVAPLRDDAPEFAVGNFLTDIPAEPFEWLFEHTLFCAIDPDQRHAYVEAVGRWLKPGGHFLAVHYLIPDTEGPPFGCDRVEVLNRFSSRLELLEEWEPPSYPNRVGLERMFWWRRPASDAASRGR